MKDRRDIAEYSLKALKKAGFQKSESLLLCTRKDELNLNSGEISLLRTTEDASLTLTGILNDRKGSITINKTDRRSIDDAASRVLEMAEFSKVDSAYDISPHHPHRKFHRGSDRADLNLMCDRMKKFQSHTREEYPSLILRQAILCFSNVLKYYMNSNGVDLQSRRGYYTFIPLFASKEGSNTSSFNYARVSTASLDMSLHRYGNLDILMEQSTQQVHSTEFQGKFIGDVIIAPECLQDFIYFVCMYLSDSLMIRGTSIFKNSLNTPISDPQLTLNSIPLSKELASGYFITNDGFVARNSNIIREGVLTTFLLSLYGANKTGKDRSVNNGDAYAVEPGDSSLTEMVASIDKGILLCRFSAGMPSASGDFSGVAKNSYYIENGEIKNPVKEIMISGNLKNLLMNIRSISGERVNLGYSILPWIQVGDIAVFGK